MTGIELANRLRDIFGNYNIAQIQEMLYWTDKDGFKHQYSQSGVRGLLHRQTPIKSNIIEMICEFNGFIPDRFLNKRFKRISALVHEDVSSLENKLSECEKETRLLLSRYKTLKQERNDTLNAANIAMQMIKKDKVIQQWLLLNTQTVEKIINKLKQNHITL